MRLTAKISLTVIAILLFAIGVTSFLNYYKYQATLSELVRSRIIVIGLDIKNAIDANVALGIPLRQTENIQEIISRAKTKDEQILSVDVIEWSADGGARLFRTDGGDGEAGELATWSKTSTLSEDPVWEADDNKTFVTGFSLVNGFGREIGAVVVRSARDYQNTKTADIFNKIWRSALMVLAAASALTFAGVFLFFRQISASFARMSNSLKKKRPIC